MGLAGSAWAECDDIFPSLYPFAAGQFKHLHLVELGDSLEVKTIEALDRWELRRLDTSYAEKWVTE